MGNLIIAASEFGNIVSGVFTPVLAKHSKSFSLIDCVSVGVDRMQRNFEPMRKQVEAWQRSELTDVTAKVVIYEAFVEGKLEAPKHLPAPSMTFTSNRNTRTSSRGRSGVSRMRSPRHSRNWSRFVSSKPQRSWVSSWKQDSRSRFDLRRHRPGRRFSQFLGSWGFVLFHRISTHRVLSLLSTEKGALSCDRRRPSAGAHASGKQQACSERLLWRKRNCPPQIICSECQ